ncbi:DHHW family protein [Porcipelethomonas sp.]|uniref:DHHW family protein n=1 Tax=Porcipelethomonas sp. TaxID=2981675 RepID=UPI003EF8AB02
MDKKRKIIMAVFFSVLIVSMPLILIFSDKKDISEAENRKLGNMPEFSASAVADKSFMKDVEKYLSDHFPERINWVRAKMDIDRLSGKDMINNIYITDSMLIEKINEPDYNEIDISVNAINKYAQLYDTEVFALIAPTSAGIYRDRLPENAPQIDQKEIIEHIYNNFSDDITCIDVFDCLINEKENYIYYRNDHHWTSYGAYCAYSEAIKQLGGETLPVEAYSIEHASSDFRGTFYAKCLYKKTPADVIDIYSLKNGADITDVILDDGTGQSHCDDIYFRDFLEGRDKYCVFLGNNRAFTDIKTDVGNGKKILVIKDSYANSFIPFLTQNYSEIAVIDLRYVKTSIGDFVNPDDYDQTLFLYNASTFAEDKNIKIAGFEG